MKRTTGIKYNITKVVHLLSLTPGSTSSVFSYHTANSSGEAYKHISSTNLTSRFPLSEACCYVTSPFIRYVLQL